MHAVTTRKMDEDEAARVAQHWANLNSNLKCGSLGCVIFSVCEQDMHEKLTLNVNGRGLEIV